MAALRERAQVRAALGAGEGVDELDVGGHPCERGERAALDPADLELAVALLGLALLDAAEEAFHGEVEIGVVVLHGIDILQVGDAHLELLGELAPAGVLRGLAALQLAAREFPEPLHIAVAALHGEHAVGGGGGRGRGCARRRACALRTARAVFAAPVIADDPRRHADRFHGAPLAFACVPYGSKPYKNAIQA